MHGCHVYTGAVCIQVPYIDRCHVCTGAMCIGAVCVYRCYMCIPYMHRCPVFTDVTYAQVTYVHRCHMYASAIYTQVPYIYRCYEAFKIIPVCRPGPSPSCLGTLCWSSGRGRELLGERVWGEAGISDHCGQGGQGTLRGAGNWGRRSKPEEGCQAASPMRS